MDTSPAPDAPQLAVQVQESFGGELGSALGIPVAVGDTTGKTNEVSSNCSGSNTAPDLSYTWTPPSNGTYRFTTEGSALDTVLTIHPVNNSTSVLGCNDDEPGGQSWSRLDLTLTAGTGYTIVVDGYAKSAGAIKLNITRPGAACTACNTPPNSCYQASGACQDGACVYSLKSFGAACDDGNFCTVNEICDGQGTCGAGTARTCNTPTNSECQEATGTCSNNQCTYAPKPSTTPCSDGNSCTVNDRCNGAGSCGGSTVTCNQPPSQCYQTNGTCNGTGCSYLPMPTGTPCNDGVACTANDVCNGSGTCSGTIQCNINGACIPNGTSNPSNACQVCDTSRSTTAWSSKSAGTACNDGNACTVNDVCNGAGSCGGTVQCSINGACFANGAANPANPCQVCDTSKSTSAWSNAGAGVACSDGNACTLNDVCNGAGACGGAPMQCTNTQGQCYQAACEAGTCVTRPKPAGAACNDGLVCTTAEACDGTGSCEDWTTCETESECTRWTGGCTTTGACQLEPSCLEGEYCRRGMTCEPL